LEGPGGHSKAGRRKPKTSNADNFREELVDQADPEFDLASFGDDCISWEDVVAQGEAQFGDGGQQISNEEREAVEEGKREMEEELRLMFVHSDRNEDGCVDREEFVAVQEMEGPPPGFRETREQSATEHCEMSMVELGQHIDEEFRAWDTNHDKIVTLDEWELGDPQLQMAGGGIMAMECGIHIFDFLWQSADSDGDGKINLTDLNAFFAEFESDPSAFMAWLEGELDDEIEDQVMFEFDSMDRSGDGRVSREEAAYYAKENMPQADISQGALMEMFNASDIDKDGFLNFEEFQNAGANYDGDGNETQARPMEPEVAQRQALHEVHPVMRPPQPQALNTFRPDIRPPQTQALKEVPSGMHPTRPKVLQEAPPGMRPPRALDNVLPRMRPPRRQALDKVPPGMRPPQSQAINKVPPVIHPPRFQAYNKVLPATRPERLQALRKIPRRRRPPRPHAHAVPQVPFVRPTLRLSAALTEKKSSEWSSRTARGKIKTTTNDFVACLYRLGGEPLSFSFRQALGIELRKLGDKIARVAAEASLQPVLAPSFLGKAS
jgi:Ca2+-binding EF-hand superfamily protein